MTGSPKLIAQEKDIDGTKYSDIFDLSLYQLSNGDYEIVVFMRIHFFFADGVDGAGNPLKWSDPEKKTFMRHWETLVKTYWSGRNLKRLPSGKSISVRFEFQIQEGGPIEGHWEIEVTKIAPGTSRTSSVKARTVGADVKLDSEDLKWTNKGGGQKQLPAVHEFGHMLDIRDEYKRRSPHRRDEESVMHSGKVVRARHYDTVARWLDAQIKAHNIQ